METITWRFSATPQTPCTDCVYDRLRAAVARWSRGLLRPGNTRTARSMHFMLGMSNNAQHNKDKTIR
jgi:hypothetical protein